MASPSGFASLYNPTIDAKDDTFDNMLLPDTSGASDTVVEYSFGMLNATITPNIPNPQSHKAIARRSFLIILIKVMTLNDNVFFPFLILLMLLFIVIEKPPIT